MKINELIKLLQDHKKHYGNIEVEIYYEYDGKWNSSDIKSVQINTKSNIVEISEV